MSVFDVADGLWGWTVEHPSWDGSDGDWAPEVASFVAAHGDEVVLVDPLLPAGEEVEARLSAAPPTRVAVLKPDHARSLDHVVARWGIPAHGPWLWWRDDVPETEPEPLDVGTELPGGVAVGVFDGRGRMETPLWLPHHRALVFADALTAPEGELRVWTTPWHEERVLPALRALLELPFERVLVSHGTPVHDRPAFEAALHRPPWGAPTQA
jgi:hypothetical protein